MGKTRYRQRGGAERRAGREYPEGADRNAERSEERQGGLGTLYVVSTPIGNLEDVTIRALRILKEVALIAAEDTRRTRILLRAYGIVTPLTSLYDQNEAEKSALLLARLQAGESVAYVSDAGTPGISDPGYILISRAISSWIPVVPVPGPSAVIAALSVSGLPMDRFVFSGFLPSKAARRREMLLSLSREERTLVFYESPHRLGGALRDIADVLGQREVVISREMTKIHEQFIRGAAAEVAAVIEGKTVKGEVTLIVAGRPCHPRIYSDEELLALCAGQEREDPRTSLRDRAERVAAETGVPRKRIYRLLLFS